MTVKAEAVPEALQRHWAFHGARLVKKGTYRGNDYYIGLGGPHYDATPKVIEPGDEWMLKGYYVSVWGLKRGQAVLGFPIYFALDHNLELTKRGREKGRIKEAEACAKENIDVMIHAGLLSEYESGIITPGIM